MANFGHFGPVDHFLAWIKVELPIRVKTEVCWGNVRSFPSRKSHFGGPRSLKIGQKWLILTILPHLTLSWPFFWLELGGTHPRNSWLRCAEVLPGLIPVKKGILGLLWPSKRPKIANFGHFNSFYTKKTHLHLTWTWTWSWAWQYINYTFATDL